MVRLIRRKRSKNLREYLAKAMRNSEYIGFGMDRFNKKSKAPSQRVQNGYCEPYCINFKSEP